MNKILSHIILLVIFLGVSVPVKAVGPKLRLSLQECVNRALKNNEEIKAAHYDVLTYVARKVEATKRYVPVIKYRYRVGPVPRDLNDVIGSLSNANISVFNSLKIEMGIPVTHFGRLEVSRELADIGIDASRLKKHQKANEVVLDIYKLYHGILLARELSVLADKGLVAIRNKVKELEREETTDQLQILKLKAIFYQIEKKLADAQRKGSIALAMLKVRIGVEDDANFDLKDRGLKRDYYRHKSFKQYLSASKKHRPEFTLIQHNVDAKYTQLKLEKKEYYPKLNFGTSFEVGNAPGIKNDDNENSFSNPFNFYRAVVGFQLSSELDFRKIKSRVDLAKAEHLKSIAEKRSNSRLLQMDLKDAFMQMEQRKKLLQRVEKEKRSARQVVFLTKSNLDIGLGEKKEYLEAVQSYLIIQAAVFENIFRYNLAVATLKSKVGKLYNGSKLNVYSQYK